MQDLNLEHKYSLLWEELAYAATTKDWKALTSAYWSMHWLLKRNTKEKVVHID